MCYGRNRFVIAPTAVGCNGGSSDSLNSVLDRPVRGRCPPAGYGRRDGDRGARVGLLRLLTGLRHLAGDSTHPVAGCGRRRYSAAYRWSARNAPVRRRRTMRPSSHRSADDRRPSKGKQKAATGITGGRPISFGVTTSMRPAARVRHETRMRCPTKGLSATRGRNGAGDVAWPQSGSTAPGFVPITSPSLHFTTIHRWQSGLMRR